MDRSCSAAVPQELVDLHRYANGWKFAANVQDFKSNSAEFIAHVSKMEEGGSSADEHTISLYEVLARLYGRNIVPQIDNIMASVVKTLTSNPGSSPLHQACAKVVSAIARYGIGPSTPKIERAKIIHSLCKPLLVILMGSPQDVASGAALCLKALVDSDNWRFASDDDVNNVCLRVACALEEKTTQTVSHMGLAMALGKHNNLTVEAYTRSLIRSGMDILTADAMDGNSSSQKKFSSIRMIHFLVKCIDKRSFISELTTIVDVMEKCHLDQDQFVREAAFETLQTARRIADEGWLKFENENGTMIDTSFRNSQVVGGSPESHSIHSFVKSDSFSGSLLSMGHTPSNRKQWNYENFGVNVSLKDGLFCKVESDGKCSKLRFEHSTDGEASDEESDCAKVFSGFADASPAETMTRSATPSPQILQSQINNKNIRNSPTRRKLYYTHEHLDDNNVEISEQQARNRGTAVCEVGLGPTREAERKNLSPNLGNTMMHELAVKGKSGMAVNPRRRAIKMSALSSLFVIFGLTLIFPILIPLMWSEHQDECFSLVPT